ncbi:MAG: type II secretion system protein GspG [Planctomycetota bacterium]
MHLRRQSTISPVCHTRLDSPRVSRVRRTPRGFSLLEVIVAVTIVAILAAVVAPNVIRWIGDAKTKSAKAGVKQIASQVRLFMVASGSSTPPDDLIVLTEGDNPQIEGGVKSLDDPWGGRYTIKVPGDSGSQFDIVSFGADKQPGGEGENADISSAQ